MAVFLDDVSGPQQHHNPHLVEHIAGQLAKVQKFRSFKDKIFPCTRRGHGGKIPIVHLTINN